MPHSRSSSSYTYQPPRSFTSVLPAARLQATAHNGSPLAHTCHHDDTNPGKSIFSGAETPTAEETLNNGVTLIIFSGLFRVILGLLTQLHYCRWWLTRTAWALHTTYQSIVIPGFRRLRHKSTEVLGEWMLTKPGAFMAARVTYAVTIRTPSGHYITLTVQAINSTAAASAVRDMAGGGTVTAIEQIG